MSTFTASPPAVSSPAAQSRQVARRIADAHRPLGDVALLAFTSSSGSTRGGAPQAPLNLCMVLATLPDESCLRAACAKAGGSPWSLTRLTRGEGRLVVLFEVDATEVQLHYLDRGALNRALDALYANADVNETLQRLEQDILKGEALFGHTELSRLQSGLTRLPPKLATAMVKRFMSTPTPWRAISQLRQRHEIKRCRELQADACYRLCAVRAALNQRHFTRFQVKRTSGTTPRFEHAPPGLAEKIERLMGSPPRSAFAQLYELEGEVLDLVAREMPQVSLAMVQAQRAAYEPA